MTFDRDRGATAAEPLPATTSPSLAPYDRDRDNGHDPMAGAAGSARSEIAAARPSGAETGANGRNRAANILASGEDSPLDGFEFRPHNCFACGELNANGLHLQLHLEPGRCWTELALTSRFEGWEEVIHGGILCTILDEVMAWSLVEQDNWGVTARMNVEFRRPVTVGQAIRAEGWITDDRRRLQKTAGRIVDAATGQDLVRADAVYVAAPEDKKRELKQRYAYREERIQALRAERARSGALQGDAAHGTAVLGPAPRDAAPGDAAQDDGAHDDGAHDDGAHGTAPRDATSGDAASDAAPDEEARA